MHPLHLHLHWMMWCGAKSFTFCCSVPIPSNAHSSAPHLRVLWGWAEDGKTLQVRSKGTGGYAEFVANLKEDEVLFGGLLVTGVDVRENVTSRRPKFVAITWIGSKLSAMKKAKVSVQRQEVQKLMNGITAAMDISDLADFTQADIAKKLLAAGGAHKPTEYEFGPNDVYKL